MARTLAHLGWLLSTAATAAGCSSVECPGGRVRTDEDACVCPDGSSEADNGTCVALRQGDTDGSSPSGLAAVVARYPWNGFATGSVHTSQTIAGRHPLRPTLMWNPVVDATHYEVQMDEACGISSFRDCAFASPEVDARVDASEASVLEFRPDSDLPASRLVPVGTRYYWRVRACGERDCSAWSEVRYLDVGRLENDYNCDGYSDVAVGATGAESVHPEASNTNEGHTFVFYGSAVGLALTPGLWFENPRDQGFAAYGSRVESAGDVNGDGCSDLLVSASSQLVNVNNEGEAFLFLGSPSGLPHNASIVLPNPEQKPGHFGAGMSSAGDMDGDGFADFVIGAWTQDHGATNEGVAYVYFGSQIDIDPNSAVLLDNPSNQEQGNFGSGIAARGDINGDGYPDLVIGAHGQARGDVLSGNAYLYLGGPTRALGAPDAEVPTDTPADSLFGVSAAGGGDFNGDGYADYAIGAMGQALDGEARAGAVEVYFGSPNAGSPEPGASVRLRLSSPKELDRFGSTLAGFGDVDGDGLADLLVGAPRMVVANQTGRGQTFLFPGSRDEFPTAPARTYPALDDASVEHGYAIATAGDINGDGFRDAVVGSPDSESGGWIDVHWGPLTDGDTQRVRNPSGDTGDRFGAWVH